MDGTSRFAKAICLKNTSATEVIREFHSHWVANFGKPVEVYVDNGSNFGSCKFCKYAKLEGFEIKQSVPHTHQLNVDGKLVISHNSHLVKATGNKPPIVPLRDVSHYLTQNGFPNKNSQVLIKWSFPPKSVKVW